MRRNEWFVYLPDKDGFGVSQSTWNDKKKGKKIINLSFLFYSSEKISTNHGIDIRQIEKKSRNKL